MKKFLVKNAFIILISFLICSLTIGYALFQEELPLNGNLTITEPGKLEITSASIIRDECANLTSYYEPTYEGLHIEFLVGTKSANSKAVYLITLTNNSYWDFTYTGFPITARVQGEVYVPNLTSTITYHEDGTIVQNGDTIAKGEEITIKLSIDFAFSENPREELTIVVNGDASVSEDNTGNIIASITPKSGDLQNNMLAPFTLNIINTYKYQRNLNLTSSNENIEIVDANGNPLSSIVAPASSEEAFTLYLKVKSGSIFLTDETTTNIIVSSSGIDNIDTGTLTLAVIKDLVATDHEKPEVGNVTISISQNNPVEGQATISWNRIDTGGSSIINYHLTLYNVDTGETKEFDTNNAVTNYTVSNLNAGNYYVTVYGTDEAGNTGMNDCSTSTTNNGYCSRSDNTYLKWRFNVSTSLNGRIEFEGDSTALIYTSYDGVLSVNRFDVSQSLPDAITITMNNTTITSGTDYTYDASTGNIHINRVTGDIVITASASSSECLVEGTLIRLANGGYKKIEDINYDDLLMVYDHENGGITYEYPIWIETAKENDFYQKTTFSDGTVLKTVGDHSIFNVDLQTFTNINDSSKVKIGTRVIKIDKEGNKKEVTITNIEIINESVTHYHVTSNRYYNVIANDLLTTDGMKVSNYLYSFNEDITWGSDRNLFLAQNDLFHYEDWYMYFPEHIFKGLRLEEAKNVYNQGMLDIWYFYNLFREENMKPLMKDQNGNIVWMVTTSDDLVKEDNKKNYLHIQNTYYELPEPEEKENFIGWLNTSDNKIYLPGDLVEVIYGMHFIAQYR